MIAYLEVNPFEEQVAEHFGQLRVKLYRIGLPVGSYGMMIAGHARAMGLILITK